MKIMEVDANKVIDRMAQQIAELIKQNIIMQTKLEDLLNKINQEVKE